MCSLPGMSSSRKEYSFHIMPHTTARHSFSMTKYLSSARLNFFLAQPAGNNFPPVKAATPNPDASVLRTNGFVRSGSFSSGSCSRYSLSSEYARSCASFHCTFSDFPFLKRSESGTEISAKVGIWSL